MEVKAGTGAGRLSHNRGEKKGGGDAKKKGVKRCIYVHERRGEREEVDDRRGTGLSLRMWLTGMGCECQLTCGHGISSAG